MPNLKTKSELERDGWSVLSYDSHSNVLDAVEAVGAALKAHGLVVEWHPEDCGELTPFRVIKQSEKKTYHVFAGRGDRSAADWGSFRGGSHDTLEAALACERILPADTPVDWAFVVSLPGIMGSNVVSTPEQEAALVARLNAVGTKRYLVLAGDNSEVPTDCGWDCYKGTYDSLEECRSLEPQTRNGDYFCGWMQVIDTGRAARFDRLSPGVDLVNNDQEGTILSLNDRELTELCFVADAIAAAPERAVEILEFSGAQLEGPSSLAESVNALKRTLVNAEKKGALSYDVLRRAAVHLRKASAPAAQTAGEVLVWALDNRLRHDRDDAARRRLEAQSYRR